MNRWRLLSLLFLLPGAAAAQATATVDGVAITTMTVARGVGTPVFLTAPRGDKRLFIVDKAGRILILANGAVSARPFLDLRREVSGGSEQGLLGLAFHPGYARNGRFFVNYTDRGGDTRIVAYEVSSDPDVARADSAQVLLSVEQPYRNHNGGWLGFGPDGYLYIGMGDGGGSGDSQNRAQDLRTHLGKILRIDVDGSAPYSIPPSNPYASGGGAPEIFASGVRNPWRPAFDGKTLYVADVGQNQYEEVSVITTEDAGANLGWNRMEGLHCFRPRTGCDQAGLVLPVFEYAHSAGCSITGGYVYRGKAIPEIAGRYFFGDYCSGAIFSFRYANGQATKAVDLSQQLGRVGMINSFGVDSDGELYVLLAEGTVEKIVPAR